MVRKPRAPDSATSEPKSEPSRLEARLRPYREYSVRIGGSTESALSALRRVPHVVEATPASAVDGKLDDIELRIRVEHGFDVRRQISSALVGDGIPLLELKPVVMTLEEIFLALVGRGDAAQAGHASH